MRVLLKVLMGSAVNESPFRLVMESSLLPFEELTLESRIFVLAEGIELMISFEFLPPLIFRNQQSTGLSLTNKIICPN